MNLEILLRQKPIVQKSKLRKLEGKKTKSNVDLEVSQSSIEYTVTTNELMDSNYIKTLTQVLTTMVQ